jgi:hypothetical protein
VRTATAVAAERKVFEQIARPIPESLTFDE